LPFQLPRSTDQIGTDDVANQIEKWDLPYDLGATDAERAQIRSFIDNNQPVPSTFGNPMLPYGYGIQNFNITVPSTRNATEDEATVASEDVNEVVIYPNPTSSQVTVQYTLKKEGHVNISLFNTLGNSTEVLLNETQPAGIHSQTFNVQNLPKGIHILRVNGNGHISTKKLLKQ
jgi:hypothetical protein